MNQVWQAHLQRESKLYQAQGKVTEKQHQTDRLQQNTREAAGQRTQSVASTAQPIVAVKPILGSGLVAFAKAAIPAQVIALKSTRVNTVVLLKPSVCDETSMEGNYFLRSDFVASGDAHGHSPRGVIQSAPFVVGSRANMSFIVAGGSHEWKGSDDISSVSCGDEAHDGITAVTLEKAAGSSWERVMSASGNNSASFARVDWDLSELNGQVVRLRAYDLAEGAWGYIAVDDVKIDGCVTLPADASQPVKLDNPAANTLDANGSSVGGGSYSVNSNEMMLVYDLGKAHHIDRFRALGAASSVQMDAQLSWAEKVDGPWTVAASGLSVTSGRWTTTPSISVQKAQYWQFKANSTDTAALNVTLREVQFHGTSKHLASAIDNYVHYPKKEIRYSQTFLGSHSPQQKLQPILTPAQYCRNTVKPVCCVWTLTGLHPPLTVSHSPSPRLSSCDSHTD